MSVDVVVEIDLAIFFDNCGEIDSHHRDGLGEIYLLVVMAGLHGRLHILQCPFWPIPQQLGGKFGRLFHANASVADVPPRSVEQFRRRRTV